MGLPLVPPQLLGGTEDLEYQAEDFFGVEAPTAAPTDFAGVNEVCRYLRDVLAWLVVGHTASGAHNDPRIPARKVHLRYDGAAYRVVRQFPDASVETFTATKLGTGLIGITWSNALANATYGVGGELEMAEGFLGSPPPSIAVVQLYSTGAYARTTTACAVRRWAGTGVATLALADGDCVIEVYAWP